MFLLLVLLKNINSLGKDIPSGANSTQIKNIVDSFAKKHIMVDTPGASIAILKDGNLIFNSTYGKFQIEKNIDVHPDSIFEFASITKTLTYISIFQLKEKGNLNLEDDIRIHLGFDFFKRLVYKNPIRIIDVMHHKGGLEETVFGSAQKGFDNVPSILDALKAAEPKQFAPPNEYISYSNYGATILGRIIEVISKKSFNDYIRENIFNKLGMIRSTVDPSLSDNEWIKNNYICSGYAGSNGKFVPTNINNASIIFSPSGSLVSTINDMIKYTAALTPSNPIPCPLFLNPSTLLELYNLSDQEDPFGPANSHGLFSTIYGNNIRSREHAGNSYRHSSELKIFPESGWAAILSTNYLGEDTFTSKLMGELFGVPKLPDYNGTLPDVKQYGGYYVNTRLAISGSARLFLSPSVLSSVSIINDTHIKYANSIFKHSRPNLFIDTDEIRSKLDIIYFEMKNNKVNRMSMLYSDSRPISFSSYIFIITCFFLFFVLSAFYSIVFLVFIIKKIIDSSKNGFQIQLVFNFSTFIKIINFIEFIKYLIVVLVIIGANLIWSPQFVDFHFLIFDILMILSYLLCLMILTKSYFLNYNREKLSVPLNDLMDEKMNFQEEKNESNNGNIFYLSIYIFSNIFQIYWNLYKR